MKGKKKKQYKYYSLLYHTPEFIISLRAGAEHRSWDSWSSLPAEDPAEERGVETLGGREPPLHLPDRHLVLGGGAEQGQAAGHGAENLVGIRDPSDQAVLVHGQRGDGGAIGLGGDGHWRQGRGREEETMAERTRLCRHGCWDVSLVPYFPQ